MAITLPTLDSGTEQDIITAIISANAHGFALRVVDDQVACVTCGGNDPFCPTCDGNGTVRISETVNISGLSRFKSGEDKIYLPNGQYVQGDLLAVFPMNYLPSGYASFDGLLAKVEKVDAHTRSWVVDRWWLKGAPHNRVYVVLREDDYSYGARV